MQLVLKSDILKELGAEALLGDSVKLVASRTREAVEPISAAQPPAADFARAKQDTLAAVDRLEAQVGKILETRQSDEKRAETFLTWGGVFAMLLPAMGLVLNILKVSDTWVTTALAGATLTGILSFLFKPGNKLLQLARERQQLLVLPHAFRARVAAANNFATLQSAAADLAAALRGESVQI
jgi:hypothetical protein